MGYGGLYTQSWHYLRSCLLYVCHMVIPVWAEERETGQAHQESVPTPGTLLFSLVAPRSLLVAHRIAKGAHSWLCHHSEGFCSPHECNIPLLVVVRRDDHQGPAHSQGIRKVATQEPRPGLALERLPGTPVPRSPRASRKAVCDLQERCPAIPRCPVATASCPPGA